MSDDRLRDEMWSGTVPILFTLAPLELTSMDSPAPLLLLLPRISYFPLCINTTVRQHFRDAVPAVEDELWLEYEGIPLKWTIPIGVLFDLLQSNSIIDSELPLSLIVHFQQFPSKKLIRCKTINTVRSHYFSSLKESIYIKSGSVKSILSATLTESNKLWDSILTLKQSQYNTIIQKFLVSAASARNNNNNNSNNNEDTIIIQQIPIRILLQGFENINNNNNNQFNTAAAAESSVDSIETDLFHCHIQRSVQSHYKSTTTGLLIETTILDLLIQWLPNIAELIDKSQLQSQSSNSTDNNSNSKIILLVQGISIPLSSPIKWLHQYLSHPDLFLYISIIYRSRQ